MDDRRPGAIDWLRGLFGGRKTETPRWSGEQALTTGRRAVIAAETVACDALCRATAGAGPGDRAAINAFGQPVGVTRSEGAHGVLGAASGLALSGRRVAGFLADDKLPDVQDLLRAAAERRLPLVLHSAIESATGNGRGHGNYHAAASSGAFLAFARNARQALDLALLARRSAELALTPALVAMDAAETAWAVQDLQLIDPELVRAYLGAPVDEIDCPTPAQTLVFGERRRRLPRWFDLDRPASLGVPLSGPDFDASVAGRRSFFSQHMAQVLEQAMAELTERTGRSQGFLTRHRMDDARFVIIAQGAVVETAEAVADELRRTKKAKVGVLGVTWLRPFPEGEILEALTGAEVVAVLDRGTEPSAETPPLMRDVRAALQGRGPRLLSATFAEIRAADIFAVCSNMLSGREARPAVRLGIAPPEGSGYPKRQAFLQRVRRDYPGLEQQTLPPSGPIDLRPEGSKSVALHIQSEARPEEALESLAHVVSEHAGRNLRGSTTLVEPGLWHARLTASAKELKEPGEKVGAQITLIEDIEPSLEMNPMQETAPAGSVIMATRLDPADLWAAMRPSWRAAVRHGGLRLFLVRGGLEELVASAGELLSGGNDGLEEVPWQELPETVEAETERELPLVVRRFEGTGSTYDNVSRFWGEFAQPRLEGEGERPVPDPYLALGAVPPCTATFHDMTAQREQVPVIEPSACTGCGKCWSNCPDSAIGSVAIGTEALLNAGMDNADAKSDEAPSATAGKLRRAFKQLAAKVDGMLARGEDGHLAKQRVREGFDWLVTQMKIGDEELPQFTAAFDATLAELATLPMSVTEPFFREPHAQKKGSGELLLLAVNPQACQGCGVCAAVCPDDAIRTEPQTPRAVESMRELWRAWEALPDTPGSSIARAAENPRVGPLPAILMSRHCLYAVAGGDGAEPGSGERLATRQITAVVEYEMQRRLVDQIRALEEMDGRLREAVQATVTAAVPLQDLGQLDEALGATAREGSDLGGLLGKLDQLGERTDLDMTRTRDLVRVARQLEQARWKLGEGTQGIGRARYGLVVAGRSAAEWAARFPRNPFGVPVTVDLAGNGADLSIGLLEGLLAERVAESRLVRHAKLLLEAPTDLPARERKLRSLSWRGLSKEEMALCPPILVLGGPDGLAGEELAGLSRLLTSGLPVKVILLDGCDLPVRGADPALLALAHREAFVLSTSVAHPDHLFEGMVAALKHTGPALIRVHAPSPTRHGFSEDATVERARSAVSCRVLPLLRYEPEAEGVFGLRLDLGGNPDPSERWATGAEGESLTPAHWAAWEKRFESAFIDAGEGATASVDEFLRFSSDERGSTIPTVPGPNGRSLAVGETFLGVVNERAANWETLRELAGLANPFTARVGEQVAGELAAAHQEELAAAKAEAEAKLEEERRNQAAVYAARVRDRLLELSSYGAVLTRDAEEEGTQS
jgi:pyruvate-ferredoxin/flavodoxin oxidoreductase